MRGSQPLTLVAKPRSRGAARGGGCFISGQLTSKRLDKAAMLNCFHRGFLRGNPPSQPWHVLAQGRNRFMKSNVARGLFLSRPNPIAALGGALWG